MDKEEAREEIKKLIEKYDKYKEDKNLMGNERQICDSLIRPFFRDVLGWNIEDPYEFKSEYGQGGKRIDYLACIEGVSQFVIEAKGINSAMSEFSADEVKIDAENCKSKYSLEYLQKFIKASKVSFEFKR